MSEFNGGPAFPAPNWFDNTPVGMTLRDYFAAKAMQAMLTNPINNKSLMKDVADHAYELSDAMIAARGVA